MDTARIDEVLNGMGRLAQEAARELAGAGAERKNRALTNMAALLRQRSGHILQENAQDLEEARSGGLSSAMLDRLALDGDRIEGMARGLEEVAALPDPIGTASGGWRAEGGIEITRVRVPLGVIGIIYEARPNVTADAAGLCLKSGNAVILRGGREAGRSNAAIASTLQDAASACGLPGSAIQLLRLPGHEASIALMQLQALDVLIPRGSRRLKQSVLENARVPCIMTGDGNCHTFVDASADLDMALRIAVNAKAQRPGVCNAMETLLVHRDAAPAFIPRAMAELAELGVELRGDAEVRALWPDARPATEEDWETEYEDLILAVRVVSDLDEAMEHIRRYGTKHSEAIVTDSYANAERFLAGVDAAAVYVNASTRFTDGGVFGFGAEMGISTQKLHARGPMGVEQLTSAKFMVRGSGQIRGANPTPGCR